MTKESTEFDSSLNRRTFIGATTLLATGAVSVLADDDAKAPTMLGYPDRQSYQPGETVRLHLSVGTAQYGIAIERVGLKRERVWSKDGLTGREHAVPSNASTHGCKWPVSLEVVVEDDWRTGFYEAVLTSDAEGASAIIDEVISKVTSLRGRLGAFQSTTLESNLISLKEATANLQEAESSIRDADFAQESAALTRAQILVQSGTNVLALANQNPQNVLALLR